MDVTTETFQTFLDDAWDAAPVGVGTLRDQLRTFEKAITPQFAQGGSLGSVSKNSASQSYRGPGLGSMTLIQIANAWRTLINLYDQKVQEALCIYNALQTNPTNPCLVWFAKLNYSVAANVDNDSVFYQMMKWSLFGFTEYEVDVSELRLHPTLGNGFVATW